MTDVRARDPLPDEHCERLQALLDKSGSDQVMNIERLDGFLAALVSGPDVVMPSEYLPLVYGRSPDEPGFATEEELREFLALLMHHWNVIVDTLRSGDVYLPVMLEDEKGIAHGIEWAQGFMQGVHLRRESWSELITNEEEGGPILAIALRAGEVDPDWPSEPLSDEKRDELQATMIAGLVRIYRYFEPHRMQSARASREELTYRRAAPKMGRNDPCPCGSGKKYKNCCALIDPGTLH
jgi:uncharacterized protein